MRIRTWIWLGTALAFGTSSHAASVETIDLKAFVRPALFESIGAEWTLPHGRQVLDGTPFQIDGEILLYRTNSAQKALTARTNVNDIPVGRRFERLHLLAGAESSTSDGAIIAKVRLSYADGSNSALDVRYGDQVRNWYGPWHKKDKPLKDPNAREVWLAQCAAAAAGDNYLRLFHVTVTNPAPDQEVRALSLESAKAGAALMVVAMSTGPAASEPEPDTVRAPQSPFPDLRPREGELARSEGVVKSKAGLPLPGSTVRVMGARPLGASSYEFTMSHPAIGTEATTDAAGRFTLPQLPDDRLYRLVVLAQGFDPQVYGGLDPKSDPIEIRLAPSGESKSKHAVTGRLVGPGSGPVVGALVEPEGVSTGTSTRWGGTQGFPEETVANSKGEFTLGRDEPFSRIQARINAPGLAPALLWLEPTGGVVTVELGVGATLRGRVLKEGKPLPGLRVGVSGAERNSEVYAGYFETKTSDDGQFAFEHLPPHTSWHLYGIMSSFKTHGALPPRPVQSGAHGETNDLGGLAVTPGLRLAGEVQTRSGQALPKDLKVRARNDLAWDSQVVPVDAAGKFEFLGLAAGDVQVSLDGLDSRAWRLAGVNRSLDLWNPFEITGLLEADKTDLVLVIEKGQRQFNGGPSGNGQLPQSDWPQNRPLSGAETSGQPPIVLAGKVVDDKTGQPVLKCQVVPGYQPPIATGPKAPRPMLKQLLEPFSKKLVPFNELPNWQFPRAEAITNGTFSLTFARLTSTPLLRIEAAGYEPFETGAIATNASDLVIRLKPGEGPSGIVLLPDGKPAEGATVIYAAERDQFSLNGRVLTTFGRSDAQQLTGINGAFAFPVRSHGLKLFAAHPGGWAEESVEHSGDGVKLRLKPWATVAGTLVHSNGTPAAGVTLIFTDNWQGGWQSGQPQVNFQVRTTTDAKGRFLFLDTPPRRLELQRVIQTNPSSWSYQLQTWFEPTPGITNDLGQVTYDSPLPPPMLDQFKQRLGL